MNSCLLRKNLSGKSLMEPNLSSIKKIYKMLTLTIPESTITGNLHLTTDPTTT